MPRAPERPNHWCCHPYCQGSHTAQQRQKRPCLPQQAPPGISAGQGSLFLGSTGPSAENATGTKKTAPCPQQSSRSKLSRSTLRPSRPRCPPYLAMLQESSELGNTYVAPRHPKCRLELLRAAAETATETAWRPTGLKGPDVVRLSWTNRTVP